MIDPVLESFRKEIDDINKKLLELLNRRAEIGLQIGKRKQELGLPIFDPVRENAMLEALASQSKGPFPENSIKNLFRAMFKETRDLMDADKRRTLLVSRRSRPENTLIEVGGVRFGSGELAMIAGPCSVETPEQLDVIASHLKEKGVRIMRGGAFKPRTSPYTFQGLGFEGLEMLRACADKYGLSIITEVMDPRDMEKASVYADIIQIGARNMYNYPLLKEAGQAQKPVMLKRAFSATIEELLFSAEYIVSSGNKRVILCERGIRTFENSARNTLDISAVPILKIETHLPVIVDISHAAGRCDILAPLAKAAAGAGADGLMIEVHHNPAQAYSDNQQQLDLPGFDNLLGQLSWKPA